jgi:hypothetical protein
MKSERRMSAGWSFAAGTLFGGIAAFVPLSSHGTPGPTAEGPQPPLRVAVEPAGRTETPVARVSDEPRAPDSVALRAPLAQEDRSPTTRNVKSASPTPVHWECELLLD